MLASATEVGYVWLLGEQGTFEQGRVVWVAVSIVVLGLASCIGAFTGSPTRRAILTAVVAGGLLPLGVLALMSIGLPLLVAGILGLSASIQALRDDGATRTIIWAVVAALVAGSVLAVGLVLT